MQVNKAHQRIIREKMQIEESHNLFGNWWNDINIEKITLGVLEYSEGKTGYYLGNISNTAIWTSALSEANILSIYNNGRPADLTSLSPVAWWRMGEEAFCPDYTATPNVWTIPDQIGSNDGTSAGNPDLVGEAPQSFANGLSVSMDIDDRIGESGFSDENALSYNMSYDARKADVAG